MVLALFCYASHGMIRDGRQVIILNEHSEKDTFYKIFGAEENMRTHARKFSNTYIVGIFACCREIFVISQHSGGINLAKKEELELQRELRARRRLERLMQRL